MAQEKPIREPWAFQGMILQADGRRLIVKPQRRTVVLEFNSGDLCFSAAEARLLIAQLSDALLRMPQPELKEESDGA